MSPEHARLAILLQEESQRRGSRKALAADLGLTGAEISDLINSKRFISMRQALSMEAVLNVSARDLLIEAAIARIDEALADERSK